MSQFSSAALRLAREAAGLTQKDLAKLLGCTQGRLSKLEDGLLKPSAEDVHAFAIHLSTPLRTFFLSGSPRSATVSFYRKAAGLPMKLLNQLEARMNLSRLWIESSTSALSLSGFPHIPPDRQRSDARTRGVRVAQQIRSLWKLPRGRIANVTECLEAAGAVVIHLDLGTKKLDGVSIWGDRLPFVFANAAFPADRLRLTKSHELAHLVMHREPHPDVEDEAWGFAMEFLVPREEIINRFYPCTLETLAVLKQQYGVSMQALLKYGQDLGQINERYARFLWMRMGQYRMREPHEDAVPKEDPRVFAQGSLTLQTNVAESVSLDVDTEVPFPDAVASKRSQACTVPESNVEVASPDKNLRTPHSRGVDA